jgi:uncharacterized protein YjiS (DUF1127 family)
MAQTRSLQRTAPVLVSGSLSFLPLLDLLREALDRRQIRRSFGRMTNACLHDIGLTPHDVMVALSLPLTEDARHALAKAAAKEAARW